jgi:predicted component of viral defense system (DUF524 family)
VLLSRQEKALEGEHDGLRLRLRLLGGRSWPDDGNYIPEESYVQLEAEDLDSHDPPEVRVHGLLHTAPEYTDGRRRVVEIQLGSTLGFMPIELRAGPRRATAEVEVRPRKLDYQAHYLAMKSELEELAQNLLLHTWQAAAEQRGVAEVERRTPAELVDLLRQLWLEVRRTFELIALDPHRDLVSEFEVMDVSRAREVGPESLADLVRQPSFWTNHPARTPPLPSTVQLSSGNRVTPMRILEERTELSYDTPPNRVIRSGLHVVRRHVREAMRLVATGLPQGHFALEAKAPYVALLEDLSRGLGGMLRQDFMAEAGEAQRSDFAQHTLEADPRYRLLSQLLKTLTLGISPKVTGRPFVASVREVWEVFEYWAYLSLVAQLLWRGWHPVNGEELFKVKPSGLVLDLVRGVESAIRFARGPDRVTLYYQRAIKSSSAPKTGALQSRTHEMKPDVMLEVKRGGVERLVVMDAKYRLDPDGINPPQSAIDDVHVYRDAIGRFEKRPDGSFYFVPLVTLGIVAFPSQDPTAFATARYSESLRQGLGAVSCLPGQEGAKRITDVCGI